jgi:monoamine oxidase
VPHLSGRVVKAHLRYRTPWWRERGWSGTAQIDDGFVAATADRSPSTGGRGILVALSTGPHADRLRALPVADRPGALAAAVEQIMPGAPAPEAVHLQDWCADPWIPGGYASHPAPGIGPWRPRPPAGIAIAGTEAATVWRSYMEGALAAGEAAATALLAAP